MLGEPFFTLSAAAAASDLLRIMGLTRRDLVDISRKLLEHGSVAEWIAYAANLDSLWLSPCSVRQSSRCYHQTAFHLVGSLNQTQRNPGDAHADHIVSARLLPAIRAYGSAATSSTCCQRDAYEALEDLIAKYQQTMVNHTHRLACFCRHTALVVARAVLQQTTGGHQRALYEHVDAFLDNLFMLVETLTAISAAAEERPGLAAVARKHWPSLMDHVMDEAERTPIFTADMLGRRAHADLLPVAPCRPYLTREVSGKVNPWRDPVTWSPQVERWIRYTPANSHSIDQLVSAITELDVADQLVTGLRWLEQLMMTARPGAIRSSFDLPHWLQDVTTYIRTPQQRARWQHIIDLLVISGDERIAQLTD